MAKKDYEAFKTKVEDELIPLLQEIWQDLSDDPQEQPNDTPPLEEGDTLNRVEELTNAILEKIQQERGDTEKVSAYIKLRKDLAESTIKESRKNLEDRKRDIGRIEMRIKKEIQEKFKETDYLETKSPPNYPKSQRSCS